VLHLPQRFAYCLPPIPRPGPKAGDLIPSEESASLWLWGWPCLLEWPGRINWLFSPVVGNKTYPGDLWGVDSRGDLLIVETKIIRASTTADPFEDFVLYAREGPRQLLAAERLYQRWAELLRSERLFIREHLSMWKPDGRPRGTFPGVVPYSSHRETAWRWQDLYRSRIAEPLASIAYERAVRRSLRSREAQGNPAPVFIGLVATIRAGDPHLSSRGRRAVAALQEQVGRHNLVFRAIRATRGPKRLRIRSWCPRRLAA